MHVKTIFAWDNILMASMYEQMAIYALLYSLYFHKLRLRLHQSEDEMSGEFLTNRISLFTHLVTEMCDDVMICWVKTLRSSCLRSSGVLA
jgi:hypothetical protein